MTDVHAGALPAPVDLEEWDADWSRRVDDYELVAGIPTMPPSEIFDNRQICTRLLRLLDRALGDSVPVLTEFDVQLAEVPATIRRPDVVVLRRPLPGATRALPQDVLLVAEVVSPSSTVSDWRDKRAEYAAAGIPAYLVVDVASDSPGLALFTEPRDGRYPDPQGADGTYVSFNLVGREVTIRLADLRGG